MNYVCFTAGKQDFPSDRLLQLLPDCENLFSIPADSPSILDSMDPQETVALVFHPYWIQAVNRFAPRSVVSFIEPCPPDADRELWEKLWNLLAAKSALVCTSSERIYLEQCFRRDSAILLTSEEHKPFDVCQIKGKTWFLRDYEMFFRDAMERVLRNRSIEDLARKQWHLRKKYYQSLTDKVNMQATVLFLLSVYQYLLGEKAARDSLLQSFEYSLLAGNQDSLQTHYRFLSAIELQAGDLEQAVNTYGITALAANEKQTYRSLLTLLQQGKHELAKAELFRSNEDFRSAVSILHTHLPTHTPSSDEARRKLIQSYLHMGQMEQALRLIQTSDLISLEDRKNFFLLKGTVCFMNGDRHAAIHHFLKAAVYDYDAIAHVLELKALDDGLASLVKREVED